MSKLHREPLVHFIILGALLFAGHMLWQAHISKADYTITVTADEMERQALIFAGENRRAPTDEDLKALLFAHVEEQALMREAQRIGLGEDDTIIRRRLAQKMRFIIEDVDTPALPGDADLKSWFKANLNNFISPETRSFSHIYLSPEAHGDGLDAKAQEVLSELGNATQDWKALGDPFMMKRAFKSLNAVEAARLFGPNFSKELFELDGTHWQGPIESAFGLHIIQLDNVTPEVIPEFQDVRGDVENAWQKEAQRTLNQNNLKELIQKYKVKVEDPNEGSAG
jgi:hypothetical protein